ncbi:MAG TPA: amidohydrolase family protein [Actinocrinis sp.]|nr:amidohydrolase family protein [Actinocrinis sp.]
MTAAEPCQPGTAWIDVHHHAYHPLLVRELRRHGITRLGAHAPMPDWNVRDSVEAMDRAGVTAAILSVILPDAVFSLPAGPTRRLFRLANELSARLVECNPGRFGALAAIPLGDPPGALAEVAYAFDVLGLDGAVLPAVPADGSQLGDPLHAPVFDELDRRKAAVFIHPRASAGTCAGPNARRAQIAPPACLESVFSTTRAVVSLLYSGTLGRCPDIEFIVAHAGGVLPYLADRAEPTPEFTEADRAAARADPRSALSTLNYEVTRSVAPAMLRCLRELAGGRRVLFGTGYPAGGDEAMGAAVEEVRAWVYGLGGQEAVTAVAGCNASRLFPRLASALRLPAVEEVHAW